MGETRRVERLILMAAGFGSRMAPATLDRPKPLVRVNGRRMVDTVIDAALSAGIPDIVVVRGYMAEAFDELLEDYPMLRFVDNPLYDRANNISSALAVSDLLANSYLAEADLILANPGLITPEQGRSNYLGVPCARTDDWAFRADPLPDGSRLITRLLPRGGERVCHMFGISYWAPEDAELLARELPEAFASEGGSDLYFEQVPLQLFSANHRVYVRPCTFEDVREVDTFEELCALDPSWRALAPKGEDA